MNGCGVDSVAAGVISASMLKGTAETVVEAMDGSTLASIPTDVTAASAAALSGTVSTVVDAGTSAPDTAVRPFCVGESPDADVCGPSSSP